MYIPALLCAAVVIVIPGGSSLRVHRQAAADLDSHLSGGSLQRLARFIILATTLLVSACGDTSSPPLPVTVQALYSSAVYDARTVTAAKISVNLTPITTDNKNLIWENGVSGSRVLVLSWIRDSDRKYYDGSVDPACHEGGANCKLGVDLWVSVAPEMKALFLGMAPQPLRIAQLLGVPPEYAQEPRSMVELWVAPRDMFRPCPDPEITDRECQAEFPDGPFLTFSQAELIRATEGPERGIFMNYTGWFNNRKNWLFAVSSG